MYKLSNIEFNYHLNRAWIDEQSAKELLIKCIPVIKRHIIYKFGYRQSLEYIETAPYDIMTKIIFDEPHNKFIFAPVKYLCSVTDNFIVSRHKLKDNQTLELNDDYFYNQEFNNEIDFGSAEIEKCWYKLDAQSQAILYMNILNGYRLNEIAEIMNINYDFVRTKKSRAIKFLRNSITNKKEISNSDKEQK